MNTALDVLNKHISLNPQHSIIVSVIGKEVKIDISDDICLSVLLTMKQFVDYKVDDLFKKAIENSYE